MKIICPYTNLTEGTELALKAEHDNDVEFVDVSDGRYFDLMYRLWKEAETFVFVEHDIVPWPGAIKQLFDCPEPLCTVPAPIGTFNGEYSGMGLGIVKIDKILMDTYPDHLDDPKLTRVWHRVDGEMIGRLTEAQVATVHFHSPPVAHLSRQRFRVKDPISKQWANEF